MPLHQLAVAPADVDGAKLALALNAPAPAPLASCRLEHPDGDGLVLGVLGASHLVVVEGCFSEQVSCAVRGAGDNLPGRADEGGPFTCTSLGRVVPGTANHRASKHRPCTAIRPALNGSQPCHRFATGVSLPAAPHASADARP